MTARDPGRATNTFFDDLPLSIDGKQGSFGALPLYRAKPADLQLVCLHPSSTFQLFPHAFVTGGEVDTPFDAPSFISKTKEDVGSFIIGGLGGPTPSMLSFEQAKRGGSMCVWVVLVMEWVVVGDDAPRIPGPASCAYICLAFSFFCWSNASMPSVAVAG